MGKMVDSTVERTSDDRHVFEGGAGAEGTCEEEVARLLPAEGMAEMSGRTSWDINSVLLAKTCREVLSGDLKPES